MEIYFTKYKDLEDKNSSPVHIKNYVKKQIRDSTELTPQSKEVLLKYPVVYVHAWKNGFGRYSIYVGETNNLSERIRQHVQSAQDTIDWHSEWVEAINNGEAFSWFFSSDKMNKSMSLDLENSLVKLIQTQLKKSLIDLETKATSVQKDYNNKTDRNNLLEKIWFTLSEFNGFGFEDYNDLDKSSLSSSVIANSLLTNEFEFEVIQPINKDDTIAQISRVCKDKSLLLNYPMVYIFVWEKNGLLKTYVGETEKLCARTEQHLEMKEQWEKDWVEAIPEARLLLFGHKSFNKSMTLEIENRLVLYTKFLKCSQNSRHNEQGMYNNQNEMFNIFQLIISKLVSWQNGFTTDFQTLEDVQKNCMALASPFYKLTEGQSTIKNQIVEKVNSLLENEKNEGKKQLIILYGGAGTGKTMLLSSLLFSLYEQDNCKCDLVVNNQELAPTYQNMIEVWQLGKSNNTKAEPIVYYAKDYFNLNSAREVLLVDEGHLLFTEDYMRAKNQLSQIVSKSRCTVLVFDPFQFVDQHKRWEGAFGFNSPKDTVKSFEEYFKDCELDLGITIYDLDKQLRMKCSEDTYEWITGLCKEGHIIKELRGNRCVEIKDRKKFLYQDNYTIAVYKTVYDFYCDLCKIRETDKESICISTYDWKNDDTPHYSIYIRKEELGVFKWHKTGKGKNKKDSTGGLSSLSWIQRAQPDETGSVHDIQGFDLNYAFVIIGPSVRYNPERGNLKGKKGIQVYNKVHKTNHDTELILNELRVLLTRGIKGLVIYADDSNLRNALYDALSEEKNGD